MSKTFLCIESLSNKPLVFFIKNPQYEDGPVLFFGSISSCFVISSIEEPFDKI
jgi:hypothetical protein